VDGHCDLAESVFLAPLRLGVKLIVVCDQDSRKGPSSQRKSAKKTRMTRRRFYAPPLAFAPDGQTVSLSADEARHARGVLRLQPGDEVYVFDGAGKEFRCAVREFRRDGAVLDVLEEVEPARLASPLNLSLGIALLKGDNFDLVVQKATELGASRLVPVATSRADVRIRNGDEAKRKVTRWQRIALEAAKQCGRARLMEIEEPLGFKALIDRPAEEDELRLMFAERNGTSLGEVARSPLARTPKLFALVGPEGGWADEEIELARKAGWQIITLGGRTLRAETAAITIVTLLQHRFGDLS
jgi:16S rRNA (uracil1498-N3)-methyltransferase